MSIVDKMAEAMWAADTRNQTPEEYQINAQAAWDVVKAEMMGDDVWPTAMIAMQDVDVPNKEGEYDWTLDDVWKAALTAAIKKMEE